jgi:hypothetical protein
VHQHRQQGLRAAVGEDLGRAEEEERPEGHRDRDLAGRDREGQDDEHGRPGEVDGHDDQPPVEPVGERAGHQPEQQGRQPLHHGRQRHHEGVVGERSDQQRAGRERDAVAQVGRPGRREQPPEAGAEPRGHGGFGQAAHKSATLEVAGDTGAAHFRPRQGSTRPAR